MDIKRIDIGVNLMNNRFDADRVEIVKRSLENGTGLIITGVDLESSEKAVEFIRQYGFKNVWCTVGVHPHNAREVDNDYFGKMVRLATNNKDIVVAIGECGLDYDRMHSPAEEQRKVFKDFQNLAEYGFPMFLHERSAVDDFIKLSKTHRNLCKRSVVHCFTGTKEKVYRYMQLGYKIGLTGYICDNRRNKDVLGALKIIPLDKILVETDAPYLTPLNVKEKLSKRNTPDNLHYVIKKIAEVKKLSYVEVEKITMYNTVSAFDLNIE